MRVNNAGEQSTNKYPLLESTRGYAAHPADLIKKWKP
jgi:hypothetical protein